MMSKHTGLNTRSRAPAPARCSAGDPVTPFEHNWILQWRGRRGGRNYLCGASLIDAEWAVTAAHCTYGIDASNMKVYVYRHRIGGGDGHECAETLNIDKKFEDLRRARLRLNGRTLGGALWLVVMLRRRRGGRKTAAAGGLRCVEND